LTPTPHADPQGVLDFWFGATASAEFGTQRKAWFVKDVAFDRLVAERFATTIDQFTRNVFRGRARSFAGDAQALAGASAMVGQRLDESLLPVMRAFVYLPFEHAEGQSMQEESVRLFTRLVAAAPGLQSMLDSARRHRAVIERFGRFPHRNAILGRVSTAEELDYLKKPGSGF
jgi:uncharacterized protein (DUF924 family)